MGAVKEVRPVKLFFGLLAANKQLLHQACDRLAYEFGPIDCTSAIIPFDQTDYYEKEMGRGLLRQWVSTVSLVSPIGLVGVKLYTNQLEGLFAEQGQRRVNIDPGYVSLSKVVLATTKDHAHRIYMGRGIYEEVTLTYKRGVGYAPWSWTYPDYRHPVAMQFFLEVRASLKTEYEKTGNSR